MSVSPAPSAGRGEIVLQPAYFTSSLFVDALHEDVQNLTRTFAEWYPRSHPAQAFAVFKSIWSSQGWTWLHFKVLDARSREVFLTVTLRMFVERLRTTDAPLSRVVALFGLYTFFYTQPSASAPPVYSVSHIPIPLDIYASLVEFPSTLTSQYLAPLRPHAVYILKTLLDDHAFYILPAAKYKAQNPCVLPREIFVRDSEPSGSHASATHGTLGTRSGLVPNADGPKKKGRPTKRDKVKKAKGALVSLERWLDKAGHVPQVGESSSAPAVTTHALLSNPPSASRDAYRGHKAALLGALDCEDGRSTLRHANEAVLTRMRRIDELAAKKGMEVGGEGGDRTGLARAEKAAGTISQGKGGLLALLEGAGLEDEDTGWTLPLPIG